MGHVSATFLENEIANLNNWLDYQHESHPLIPQKKQKRDHYVWKLSEMDEHDLKTIEI